MGHRPAATVKPMRQEDLGQQYNIIYILFRIIVLQIILINYVQLVIGRA